MSNEGSNEDGAIVESWGDLSKAELLEECKARSLPITGNKRQLEERLEAYDRDHPDQDQEDGDGELPFEPEEYNPPEDTWIGKPDNPPGPDDVPKGSQTDRDGQKDPDPQSNPDKPARNESDQPSGPDEPKVVFQKAEPKGNTFHAEFDLPTGYEFLHEELDHGWKLEARNQAIAAGRQPIGGAYAAHNIGFGSRDGKVTIIYNVPIKAG